ncbi:MAG TPA: hypothetical protein VKQ06_09210 [Gammaproteobacteria bacterium]|nr:hypothetical protein [Gammaproteobacteria bacterium]
MAKRRFAENRKRSSHETDSTEAGSAASVDKRRTSKGYRGSSRLIFGTRIEGPQGWRSTFMTF